MNLPTNRPPNHPGEILKLDVLDELNLTQAEAARQLGMPLNRLNQIVKGKRGITPDTALRLGEVFGIEAPFWLNLQLAWDLWHAQAARRKAGARLKMHPRSRARVREAAAVATAAEAVSHG
jgi:antitoxin HigA-1